MSVPTFTIDLQPVNLLTLKNTDSVNLYFALYQLSDDGTTFNVVTITPTSPLNLDGSLPPSGTFQMYLADNLYKIFISNAPVVIVNVNTDPGYYILADQNIKACERSLILKNLCPPTGGCDAIGDRKYIEKRVKFLDLKFGLYYIYSNWIQHQAYTMLFVPTNQELLSMRDYLTQLLALCGCSNTECKQCTGGYI